MERTINNREEQRKQIFLLTAQIRQLTQELNDLSWKLMRCSDIEFGEK